MQPYLLDSYVKIFVKPLEKRTDVTKTAQLKYLPWPTVYNLTSGISSDGSGKIISRPVLQSKKIPKRFKMFEKSLNTICRKIYFY